MGYCIKSDTTKKYDRCVAGGVKMRKGRVYKSIAICIIAVLFAVIFVPRPFYGAKSIDANLHGGITFVPNEQKLISELEDAGLKLVAKNDGTNEFTAESSSGSSLGNWIFASNAHKKLIEYGILSYEMYTYTPESCTTHADLTIILDFSGYAVTTFDAEAIYTLRSAITGNGMIFNLGALTPKGTLYNQDGSSEEVQLSLKGNSGMTATTSQGKKNITSYALRLVFPGGYGDIELLEKSVSFNDSFMDLPVALEFDLREFTAVDRLVISDGASDYNNTGGTNHLHILCNDESQLKYTVGKQKWEIKKYLFRDNIYKKM